jgi:4-diphosphocytidyl-2-C-methyl-D-erythritol kinase
VAIRVFAPAKVNLALHVTGQRPDGYHLLDSLVAFADVGDWVTLGIAGTNDFLVSGPEADAVPMDATNIVLRVADRFWRREPLAIHLEKNLPVASGIGGGSTDAAACYRGLRALSSGAGSDTGVLPADDLKTLLALGADLPMCVIAQPARVRGIGEDIEPLKSFAPLHALLVNPRVAVSTPSVFKALVHRNGTGLGDLPRGMPDAKSVTHWLADQRNDLEPAAITLAPQIRLVLDAIRVTQGCSLARMSGSGATCFGLYDDGEAASSASAALRHQHPGWWIVPTILGHGIQPPVVS